MAIIYDIIYVKYNLVGKVQVAFPYKENEIMKNEMKIFNNELFGNIRVGRVNDKPYFVATDIAKILGYKNISDAISRHCKGVVKHDIPTNGGVQTLNVIPEGDIYRLIVRSKLPNAEKFESWVFDEVLPTIRENGGYIVSNVNDSDEDILARAVLVAQKTIEKKNELILQLENKIETDKPLVTFAERVLVTEDNILIQDLAKTISDSGYKIGRNRLYNKLRDWGLIFKRTTEPTQYAMEREYFVVEEKIVDVSGKLRAYFTTKITPKGQIYITNRLMKENNKKK